MTTTALKKKLHKAIEITDDSALLEAVYTILNRVPVQYDYDLSPEQENLIETRRKLFKQGKLKTVTLSEIRKKALQRIAK